MIVDKFIPFLPRTKIKLGDTFSQTFLILFGALQEFVLLFPSFQLSPYKIANTTVQCLSFYCIKITKQRSKNFLKGESGFKTNYLPLVFGKMV